MAIRLRRSLADGRVVLLASLALAWLNFLLTTRWASLPGALNGWKRPWYALALVAATAGALFSRRIGRAAALGRRPARIVSLVGCSVLAFGLLSVFPPAAWGKIPFTDDWPARFQSTVDAIALYGRGAVVGWNWSFLGGYPTSTDLTQHLGALGVVPMTLFGRAAGFHLLHVLMFAVIVVCIYWDAATDDAGVRSGAAAVTAGLGCLFVTGFLGTIMPSGGTNSIAGVLTVVLALTGSRAAQLGRRWGPALLVLGLTLSLYSHAAFFLYAAVCLGLEALFYRSWPILARAVAATVIAAVAGLPLYWEMLRYPSYFVTNNLVFQPPASFDWGDTIRQVYYAAEILLQPHRWFNDYVGLVAVWLPVFVFVAIRSRKRAGFYAWAALAMIVLLRFNARAFGFLFAREMHLLPVFAAPVLASFILDFAGSRTVAIALLAVVGLYVQAWFAPIAHESGVRAFNQALVDQIGTLPGNLVLVENAPHFNMVSTTGQRSERPLVSSHYEALLPEATGRRFYAQIWDGWHWSVFRGHQVAGGAFRGRLIADTPPEAFAAEMRKWGVGRLLVWSRPMRDYLAGSNRFRENWESGTWTGFEPVSADTRSVAVDHGKGELKDPDSLSATIELEGVTSGDVVVVRTNYYPAWRAQRASQEVPVFAKDGQLAFRAPDSGTYAVELRYPRRALLAFTAMATLIGGALLLTLASRPPRSTR